MSTRSGHAAARLSVARSLCLLAMVAGFLPACRQARASETPILRDPDVLFVPTPQASVDVALRLADVTRADVVFDLGSGDGRVVLAAARDFGARGVGIEMDSRLVDRSRVAAEKQGLDHLVRFRQQDLFLSDLREATVVFVYLLPAVNVRLLPKLASDLRPGTRIVAYRFGFPGWAPDRTARDPSGDPVYLWRVPNRLSSSR